MSKKLTVNADGSAATVADATLSDIGTTIFATDTALTGTYGLVQKVGLVAVGMAAQEFRRSGSIKFW